MLEDLFSPPTWRPVNSVNIWNFLWLSSRRIIETEPKIVTKALFLIQKSRHRCTFLDKSDLRVMSRTAITSKFKMCLFPNEECY